MHVQKKQKKVRVNPKRINAQDAKKKKANAPVNNIKQIFYISAKNRMRAWFGRHHERSS